VSRCSLSATFLTTRPGMPMLLKTLFATTNH
jgi:hypothetical protein